MVISDEQRQKSNREKDEDKKCPMRPTSNTTHRREVHPVRRAQKSTDDQQRERRMDWPVQEVVRMAAAVRRLAVQAREEVVCRIAAAGRSRCRRLASCHLLVEWLRAGGE